MALVCYGNFVTLLFSEIPLRKISHLIETSQMKFAFALLDFLLGGFSDQIKIDLLADFHNRMEILETFALIPLRKFIFLT